MATDVNTVAVLFALEREAAPFRRVARGSAHVSVHVSGVGRRRARLAVDALLNASRPGLVIAAGFCGALTPRLHIGDVLTSRLLTVDRLVNDPADKRRRHGEHDLDPEHAAQCQ
jgi:adenosylhomocysteine nucleosidase